jgi:hypothetical protein
VEPRPVDELPNLQMEPSTVAPSMRQSQPLLRPLALRLESPVVAVETWAECLTRQLR